MNNIKGIFALAAILAPLAASLPASAAIDRVTNGSFEITSPLSFKSDYTKHGYGTGDPTKGTGHDFFELGNIPHTDNNSWITSGDHTSGSGKFMLVDGSTSGTARVWYESFSVVAGRTYALSAWGESFLAKNPATLHFTINGAQVGGDLTLGTPGVWSNLNTDWTAGASQTITFAVVDTTTAASGNDFGLDDISFKPVPEASTVVTFALLCIGGFLTLRKRSQAKANA